MFFFKKIVAHILMPPGIFAVALLLSGLWFSYKKSWKAGVLNLLLGSALWILAIVPVSDVLMRGLEEGLQMPAAPRGDVIILLGGGVYSDVQDFSGVGVPSREMLQRIVTAVRLQKKLNVPVIISGGKVFPWEVPEVFIDKRFLVDLGVPIDKIIVEDRSRDTIENAKYSKEICEKYRFTQPLLVTSASHMKRSLMSFKKVGVDVTPFPANLNNEKSRKYIWMDYLPGDMENTVVSLREYGGLLFYKIAY